MKALVGLLLFTLAAVSIAADKKPKPSDVEVLEASAHRGETRISIDGRIRNSGERALKKLTLLFHFMAPGKQVVTTQKSSLDEELLDRGQEVSFHVELNAPPRSVEVEIG